MPGKIDLEWLTPAYTIITLLDLKEKSISMPVSKRPSHNGRHSMSKDIVTEVFNAREQ